MERAIVLGTFDLTHYGHYRKFKLLKELGYYTIAGVTSDEFATLYKRKPVMSQVERMENLEHCKWVDLVVALNTNYDHTDEAIATRADVIVHSRDWSPEAYGKQTGITTEWLNKHNKKRLILPYTPGVSTSKLRGIKE